MLRSLYSRKQREDGFTLIELLVVVIIIGILAAIALPIFIDQQKVAVDAAVKSDVHNTALAVQEWRVDHQNATAADAAAYLAQGGHLVSTANNGYLGVVVNADGSYGVCGYNSKGKVLTGPASSFVFEASSGQFDVGTGCYSAVGFVADSNTGDGSATGEGNPQNGAAVQTLGDTDPGSGAAATPAGGRYRLSPKPGDSGTTVPKITRGGSTPVTGDPGNNPGAGTSTTFSVASGNGLMPFLDYAYAINRFAGFLGNNTQTTSGSTKTLNFTNTPALSGATYSASGTTISTSASNIKLYHANGTEYQMDAPWTSSCTFTGKFYSANGTSAPKDYYSLNLSCPKVGRGYLAENIDDNAATQNNYFTFTDSNGALNKVVVPAGFESSITEY